MKLQNGLLSGWSFLKADEQACRPSRCWAQARSQMNERCWWLQQRTGARGGAVRDGFASPGGLHPPPPFTHRPRGGTKCPVTVRPLLRRADHPLLLRLTGHESRLPTLVLALAPHPTTLNRPLAQPPWSLGARMTWF